MNDHLVRAGHDREALRRENRFINLAEKITGVANRHRERYPMITIVARCSVKAEKVDELVELALDLVKSSRNESGNVSYNFYEDLEDPTKFMFIEVWKDQAAIDSHNAAPHFLNFVEKAEPLLTDPLDVALYRKRT